MTDESLDMADGSVDLVFATGASRHLDIARRSWARPGAVTGQQRALPEAQGHNRLIKA